MSNELVYLGFDRAGLDEARRDVERHAAKVARSLIHFEGSAEFAAPYYESAARMVYNVIKCPQPWPTVTPRGVLVID
jgi:hypothetical protein